jgi:hypothetical protein
MLEPSSVQQSKYSSIETQTKFLIRIPILSAHECEERLNCLLNIAS